MDSLRPGDPPQIGDYILYGRLGAGGMGEVFFGRSAGGKAVAVKLINPLFASDAQFRRRFRLEVEAGRKVGGFHAAQVIDADPDADRPWMATTYVAGPSLKQVLDQYRALPPHSVKVLGAGLAEALTAIHDAEIIHRDLKPSNILLAYDGPHVIDFGIARAVDASALTTQSGTPGFIAPEILKGQQPGKESDIFALGVVLAVAAGIFPFGEGPQEAISYRIINEEPDLSGLDPEIRTIVEECLAKEPGNRPEPREILRRLGDYSSVSDWLPEPIRRILGGFAPPQVTDVARPGRQRDAWLLEAEQAARRVPDGNARAEAQLYVATVVSRSDPAHALRLLDDALRPTVQRDGTSTLSRQEILRHLTENVTFELGTVLARAGVFSADQTLDEIEDIIRSMARERPDSVPKVVIELAKAVAGTDPARADRVTLIPPDQSVKIRAMAQAAMVMARTDPVRAEQIARAITRLAGQAARPVAEPIKRSRRWWWTKAEEAPCEVPSAVASLHEDLTKLWAAKALAEVAVVMVTTDSLQTRRPPAATEAESTITASGDLRVPSLTSARAKVPASPEQLLSDADQLARSITAGDTRALALTSVTIAAAQVDPGRAGSSLTEAEQFARTSNDSSTREKALGEVALAAARSEPALAEQIARSLPDLEQTVAQIASAVAATDHSRAERIAAAIHERYVKALAMAKIAVQADPAHAEPQVSKALQAAHHDPAHMVEVAMVAARTGPARAEEVIRAIKSRDNKKTADFWRAKALADLASMSDRLRACPMR